MRNKITQAELDEILAAHREWNINPQKGKRAELINLDLTDVEIPFYDMKNMTIINCKMKVYSGRSFFSMG